MTTTKEIEVTTGEGFFVEDLEINQHQEESFGCITSPFKPTSKSKNINITMGVKRPA